MQQVRVIKDRDGNVLTGSTRVMERWTENFEDLVNDESVGKHRVAEVAITVQKAGKGL